MLTIQTSVYNENDNTIKSRLRKFLNTITHPLNTEKMKKFYDDMQNVKKNAYLEKIYVSLPAKDAPEFDTTKPLNIKTTHISEEEKKWCKNRDVKSIVINGKEYLLHDDEDVYYAYSVVESVLDMGNNDKIPIYKTCIYYNGIWISIKDAKVSMSFRQGIKCLTITLDDSKAQEYEKMHYKYNLIQKCGSFTYDALHTVDSIILCLRFPFLYPRNRFSGLHYNNWKIVDYIKKLRSSSVLDAHVRQYKDENNEEHPLMSFGSFPKVEKEVITDESNTMLKKTPKTILYFIHNQKKIILYEDINAYASNYYPVKICNSLYIYTEKYGWRMIDEWEPVLRFEHENDDKYPWIDSSYSITMNHLVYWYSNVIEWFHDWVLAFVFCIPTYNELDAMPEGWRRKFGIQMCKEMRKALWNDKCLFSYRITQIKEKFGQLRWYDARTTNNVQSIISKYEDISERTCIDCGKPAKYRTTGWICPYCEDCIGDDKSTAVELDKDGREIDKNETNQ